MVQKTVLTALFLVFAFGIFGPKIHPVYADCKEATSQPGTILLSCVGDYSTNCPVRSSEAGGGKLFCCLSTADCITFAQNSNLHTGVQLGVPSVCKFASGNGDCVTCMTDGKGSWTAFGCIPADPTKLIETILKIGLGLGGGVAFLLILFGGFQILTSAGNPEQLTAGRELVTSAITGLLLIIFSVFILRLIGFNILGIPGFG